MMVCNPVLFALLAGLELPLNRYAKSATSEYRATVNAAAERVFPSSMKKRKNRPMPTH
jgi:hypothetical protein